jgi:hypothetical protein
LNREKYGGLEIPELHRLHQLHEKQPNFKILPLTWASKTETAECDEQSRKAPQEK